MAVHDMQIMRELGEERVAGAHSLSTGAGQFPTVLLPAGELDHLVLHTESQRWV